MGLRLTRQLLSLVTRQSLTRSIWKLGHVCKSTCAFQWWKPLVSPGIAPLSALERLSSLACDTHQRCQRAECWCWPLMTLNGNGAAFWRDPSPSPRISRNIAYTQRHWQPVNSMVFLPLSLFAARHMLVTLIHNWDVLSNDRISLVNDRIYSPTQAFSVNIS